MITTLYKLGGSGLLVWCGAVKDNSLIITHGRYDGQCQQDTLDFPSPEKARVELERRVSIKTTKQGYTEEIPTSVPRLPMLLQRYDKFRHKLPGTVYVQPKLNGIRGLLSTKGLVSRRGTHYWSLPHLTQVSRKMSEGVVLDGELYCHGMGFQEICSIVKRDTFHPKFQEIKLHVFDIQLDLPFQERLPILREYCDNLSSRFVVPVTTDTINIQEADYYLNVEYKDFEGVVLRDPSTHYEYNRRSYGVQKLKRWEDEEFQIVGIKAATTGREKGAAIFTVDVSSEPRNELQGAQSNLTTDVRPALSLDHRRSIYRERDQYIGWWTRVKFEGYSEDGKLLKPTAEGLYSHKKGMQ